jgi:uncharacterized protein (DUF2141 family)
MKRTINKLPLTLTGLIISSNIAFSQFSLGIKITDLRNNTGKIMLQVFDEKEKVIDQEIGHISDKSHLFTVKNLTAGKYAVRFYHDENLNQVMETNLVGKPTEGYGFSNNVTGKFSMPPFEKWIFSLKADTTIVLKTVY